MPDAKATTVPVPLAERSRSMDVLRGVAMLGIFVMNVVAGGLHSAAYMNPLYHPEGLSGVDRWTYWVQALVFDQRFMTIFTLLFGAGIVIVSDRATRAGANGARAHYRRALALIVIGLLHAYALWYGDVLFVYGLCGLWVYLARGWRPRTQLIVAGLVLIVPIVTMGGMGAAMQVWYTHEITDAVEARASGAILTAEQEGALAQWERAIKDFAPSTQSLEAEIARARGSAGEVLARNAILAAFMHFFMVPLWGLWRVTGLMLAGMALLRLGFLHGSLARRAYVRIALVGYGLGLPLAAWGVWDGFSHGMLMPRMYLVLMNVQYVASLLVAAGHISLVMLLVGNGNVSEALSRVGRMSLSCYLTQSIMMLVLFSGLGFGLFERLGRAELMAVVVGASVVQVAGCWWWLGRHRVGPAERLLRAWVHGKQGAE